MKTSLNFVNTCLRVVDTRRRQTWPLTNLFPPYNVEKVRALNQWFIY
jgi:hypothetical protein